MKAQRILAATALLFLLSLAGGVGTWSAFSDDAPNAGNSISSGTVSISDNDAGGSMFSLSGLEGGDTATGCVKVTYNGSLPADVRVYGSAGGLLATYTSLTITRGTYSGSEPGFDSCTNFTPDSTTYVTGQAPGVVYSGRLADLPGSWTTGVVDPPSGASETWTSGEVHVYKFELAVADNDGAAGKSTTPSFTWEARSQ